MSSPRSAPPRFSADRLFRPSAVLVLGAETADGKRVRANLEAGFSGAIHVIETDAIETDVIETGGEAGRAAVPTADLAVLCGPAATIGPALAAVGAAGIGAAVVTSIVPDLASLAAASRVRVLGPGSFGIAVPGIGFNASVAHLAPTPGRVALLSQSASLCRAVIDWAEPNGVGFSHIVGIGGNADIGFALVLDWLSRDPGTGAVLMDIRLLRDRRVFISAARAASRLRPVIAMRAGGWLRDPSGQADAVFTAALHRAGVLVVSQLEEFLAAAETLTRARSLRHEGLAIVSNALGPGRLAADAAIQAGLPLVDPPPAARQLLTEVLPGEALDGIIYTGTETPIRLAEAAALLTGLPDIGGVLTVHAPTGAADDAGVAALTAAAASLRVPLIACVMGEISGAAHRRRLAQAGLPVFATPELGVRGFLHLVRQQRARAAAAELPPARVLAMAPDAAAVGRIVMQARQQGRQVLASDEARAVLAAYGIGLPQSAADAGADAATAARDGLGRWLLSADDDPTFGPFIALGGSPRPGRARSAAESAFELPPLNLALAHGLIRRLAAVGDLGETLGAAREYLADQLVRLSQLLVEWPEIARLQVIVPDGADAALALRAPGERGRLAIAPYPVELQAPFALPGDGVLLIRPIRPEDAAAHADFIRRIPDQDLRYRFFTTLHEISAEQMARLTQIDYDREMAFVAVRDGETVGVSRLVREPGTTRAEFAILVQPDVKGTGLATHLMRRLIDWGAAHGVTEIFGEVLRENRPMLGFVQHLGFARRAAPDAPDIIEVVLPLPAAPDPTSPG